MTNTQFPNDLGETVPSQRLWLRSELMGTQVITRDGGRLLGVVGEVVVDIDTREIVALGLRDNPLTRFLPGLPKWMLLDRIRQVGDVILVDSVDSLSDNFLSFGSCLSSDPSAGGSLAGGGGGGVAATTSSACVGALGGGAEIAGSGLPPRIFRRV